LAACAQTPHHPACRLKPDPPAPRSGIRFVVRLRSIICGLAGTSTTSSGSWGTPPSPRRNGTSGA
jgi:hypothetical protein